MQTKSKKIQHFKKLINEEIKRALRESESYTFTEGDADAVRELLLFAENDSKLYDVLHTTYVPALQKFIDKGVFDETKALKLLEYYFTNHVRPAYKKYYGDVKLSPTDRKEFSKQILAGLKDEGYLDFGMSENTLSLTEEINWNAVNNAVVKFLKSHVRKLEMAVNQQNAEETTTLISSILDGLSNAQNSLNLK